MTHLTLPSGVVIFHKNRLEFTRPLTREEWEQVGRYVTACRRAGLFWLADWRRVGRRNFGDEVVSTVEGQLELEFKDLKEMEALESLETRSESLSPEHHFVVSKRLADPAEQKEWLATAERENLSARELQDSIKAGSVIHHTPPESSESLNASDKSTGLVTIEGIRAQFDLWLKKVESEGFPSEWKAERLARVSDLLKPIADSFTSCVKAELEKRLSRGN